MKGRLPGGVLASTKGNSVNRHLPLAIVNLVYYSVMFDVNTKVIFVFGQPSSRSEPWIVLQAADSW